MSDDELQPIQKALEALDLHIPVFIISINKMESEDIVAFDESWSDKMPYSGTYINIGNRKYLLFNNTRYNNQSFRAADGWPFPIKLKIDGTDKSKLDDTTIIRDLIDQGVPVQPHVLEIRPPAEPTRHYQISRNRCTDSPPFRRS